MLCDHVAAARGSFGTLDSRIEERAEDQSKVFGCEASALRDPCQHLRSNLFVVVEGEDEIGPAGSSERSMGAGLALETPANSDEGGQYAAGPC